MNVLNNTENSQQCWSNQSQSEQLTIGLFHDLTDTEAEMRREQTITAEGACASQVDLIAGALRGTDDIVAVTGATGWLGAVTLDLFYEALGDQAAAQVVGYASSEREVAVPDVEPSRCDRSWTSFLRTLRRPLCRTSCS